MLFKRVLIVILLLVLSLPMAVLAQDAEEDSAILFIGTVTGTPDEFVGLAVDGENVTFYICDGRPEENLVSIAQWFVGTLAGDTIDITAANGNRVQIIVTVDAAIGTLTFTDGTTKEFVMTLAEDEAALYRSDFAFGEVEYVGGWLVLADGTVRGAVFQKGTEELVPATLVGPGL